MCSFIRSIAILLVSVSILPALDPSKRITQYSLDSWQARQGLPQSTVRSLAQTADGMLWLGTPAGLVRFDGLRFTIYDKHNTPSMPHQVIWPVASSPRDGFLIGAHSGLLQMRDFTI